MILELIDRRYSSKMKTIITSNFKPEELKQKLGDRTASRLLDNGNEILQFWSTDRRTDSGYEKKPEYNPVSDSELFLQKEEQDA
jgi:DNA replication protein DnaC